MPSSHTPIRTRAIVVGSCFAFTLLIGTAWYLWVDRPSLPWWVARAVGIVLVPVLVGIFLLMRYGRQDHRRLAGEKGRCWKCGQPLYGQATGTCPRCGTPVDTAVDSARPISNR